MKHVLMYAKIIDDKDMGSLMVGIYFGGVFDVETEANEAAKKCISDTHGGITIPKILPMADNKLQDVISHSITIFDRMADNIYESEKTMSG